MSHTPANLLSDFSPATGRLGRFWASVIPVSVGLAALIFGGGNAFATMSVTDTTGWNSWYTASGTLMTDPLSDQQTGQGQDDFVGGFKQQAGYLASDPTNEYIMWQTQMNKYSSKGFNGNLELGMDFNNDGKVDLIMMLQDKSVGNTQVQTFSFATPGTGANDGPSTTTWGNFAGSITLAASAYNYAAVPITDTQYGTNTNSYVTFAISYANLQAAIRAYAGASYSSFVVDDYTGISFIAFTSTQGNAINQDLFGTSGNTNSSSTFASLGAGTSFIRPGGGPVPEPAAAYQLGGLLGVGLIGWAWRKRRFAGKAAVSS